MKPEENEDEMYTDLGAVSDNYLKLLKEIERFNTAQIVLWDDCKFVF